MTTLDKLQVLITAQTEQIRLLGNETKKLRQDLGNLDEGFKRVNQSSKSLKLSLGDLSNVIGGVLIEKMRRELVSVADEMQRLNARMVAVTGSMKRAQEAMDFLRKMSSEQSVALTELSDGYLRLLPSVKAGIISMQDMREILRLANDNIKAFGLSTGETQGLFLGLSQVLGSGTVTMEDLRQVTDRLPGSLNLMAEALGKDVGGLKELIATGKVTTDQILPALMQAFRANEGAAASMADTYASAKIALQNAFSQLSDGTGILDLATTGIKILTGQVLLLTAGFYKARIAFNEWQGDLDEVKDLTDKYQKSVDDLAKLMVENFDPEIKKNAEQLKRAREELKNNKNEHIELRKAVNDNTKEFDKFRKSLQDAMKAAEDDLNKKGLTPLGQKLYDLDQLVNRNRESFNKLSAAEKSMVQQTKELYTEIDRLEQAEKRAQEMQEQWKKAQEDAMQPFLHGIENVQDALADMLVEGQFSFESLGNIAKRVAAEVAAAWIIKPIVAPIFSGAAASSGISMPNFGGFGPSGLLSGLGQGTLGGFGGLNQFGAARLGTGLPGLPGGLSSATLGSILGAAGIGAVGGGLLNNLIGGKSTGGSIGGGLGAGVGMAFGGPLGALLGGTAGSLIGGMFGAGKPTSASEFAASLGQGSGFSSTFGAKNGDIAFSQGLASQLSGFISAIETATGVDVSGKNVRGGFNTNQFGGGFLQSGQFQALFDEKNPQSIQNALNSLAKELLATSDVTNNKLVEALKDLQLEGKGAEEVIRELAIASGRAATDFNKAINDQILQATDPIAFQIQKIREEAEALRKEAMELGGDTSLVSRLEQLRIEQLTLEQNKTDLAAEAARSLAEAQRETERIRANFASISASLSATLGSLKIGNLSTLSPAQKAEEARKQFESLATRAQLGDMEALQGLSPAALSLLETSRAVNASGINFAQDYARVEGVLSSAQAVASRQAQVATVQPSAGGAVVTTSDPQLNSLVATLVQQMAGLNTRIDQMTSETSRMSYAR